MRIFQRSIDLVAGEWGILCVDPHLIRIPYDDLVARVTEEVQHFDTLRGMTIFGEGYHLAAPSINHAAFLAVRIQQDQILAVSGPIDRDDDIAVRTGFVAIKHISVAIIEQYDALAAPECGDGPRGGCR